MSEKPEQARKRQASASLRAVASELNITGTRRSYDTSKTVFSSLLKDVLAQSSTPDQRRRAEEAKAVFFGPTAVSLPARHRRVTVPSHKNCGFVRCITDALLARYHLVPQTLWFREVRYRRVTGALPSRSTKTIVF